jgi:hypothetical protein
MGEASDVREGERPRPDLVEVGEVGTSSGALLVQVEAGQGHAAPGNTEQADVLVVVTDSTGAPVVGPTVEDFSIINHFSLPTQACGFSNNIAFFNDVGTGAYQIRVGLAESIPGCAWVAGDYLAQVIVSAGARAGQGTATLTVR